MKLRLNEEVTYIRPGTRRLITPEELFLKDSQNNQLIKPTYTGITKTVQVVLSTLWK